MVVVDQLLALRVFVGSLMLISELVQFLGGEVEYLFSKSFFLIVKRAAAFWEARLVLVLVLFTSCRCLFELAWLAEIP